MLTSQRRDIIRSLLERDGQVLSGQLAQDLALSEDTIRRDLRAMAQAGECRRVYGGAVAPHLGPITARIAHRSEEKSALAAAAARLVEAGQTIILDAGSTNLAIARALPERIPLTVVTNALDTAQVLAARPGVTLILLGGAFDPESGACLGPTTREATRGIAADVLFLGTCGLHPDRGATAFEAADAEVKRAMIAASGRVILAATRDKLDAAAPYRLVPPEGIDTIVVADAVAEKVRAAYPSRVIAASMTTVSRPSP